jgi:Ca2+-binding EF-hand superfamily protein
MMFDKRKRGRLSREELMASVVDETASLLSANNDELIRLYFGDGGKASAQQKPAAGKELSPEEFGELFQPLVQARLKSQFQRYDSQGTGYISIKV